MIPLVHIGLFDSICFSDRRFILNIPIECWHFWIEYQHICSTVVMIVFGFEVWDMWVSRCAISRRLVGTADDCPGAVIHFLFPKCSSVKLDSNNVDVLYSVFFPSCDQKQCWITIGIWCLSLLPPLISKNSCSVIQNTKNTSTWKTNVYIMH